MQRFQFVRLWDSQLPTRAGFPFTGMFCKGIAIAIRSAKPRSSRTPLGFGDDCCGVEELSSAAEISRAHAKAISANKSYYIDPMTGYKVMTRDCHLKRGKCCGSMCRHCPFEYENVTKPPHSYSVGD